jgi:hypothetical protein
MTADSQQIDSLPLEADSPGNILPRENPYDPESSQDPALTMLRKVARHEEALTALQEVSFEQALMETSTTTWVTPPPYPRRRRPPQTIFDTWPKMKYPPHFLADIGLYSIFLVIHQLENY